ncbi:hypothetical protein FH972_017539 [Carpinus fangiana]|uniref:Uncharacterized protein n=1 Tax=Carpinus fangiana TaxID=176857 RepID=A0A5N6RJQ8_9ROSI|nr:hypothetical protein FH972_017539 [Carpinus fangiana]
MRWRLSVGGGASRLRYGGSLVSVMMHGPSAQWLLRCRGGTVWRWWMTQLNGAGWMAEKTMAAACRGDAEVHGADLTVR